MDKKIDKTDRSDKSEYLTIREVAEMLHIGRSTIQKWSMKGVNLPFIKSGKRIVRVKREAVEAYIAEHTRPVQGEE